MSLAFNIGHDKYRVPADHRGLYPEGFDRRDLAQWISGVRRDDMMEGVGMERPWDTSGNDPLKPFKWSSKYRQMEKRVADASKMSKKFRKAEADMKAYQRRKELKANPGMERELREKWQHEDALEEADNERQAWHARNKNMAGLISAQNRNRTVVGRLAKNPDEIMDDEAEEYRMRSGSRRRAGLEP